ncbi:MAG: SH3 domain-containing protein [Bacillota bacterium]
MSKMQKLKLAPGVKKEMLNPEFWIGNSEKNIVMTKKEINKFNQLVFEKAKQKGKEEEFCNLSHYPDIISRQKLYALMEDYSLPEKIKENDFYNKNSEKISKKQKKELIKNAKISSIKDEIKVEFGVLIKRANMRAFPTNEVFATKPETIDQDILQLTALSVGSPCAILHISNDKKWYYIQAKRYRGWVKKDKIAIAENKKEALSYFDTNNFLVVIESRVETEPNPFDNKISNILFQMGDKIPLVKNGEIPDSIPENNQQAQSPEGSYVVWLPVKGEKEKLKFKKALIARSNDLKEGYLNYTRENLLKQAFKLLGERYGWGGLYKRRDCSRFIMDIYRTVGIQIPRDAGFPQEEISAGKVYKFNGGLKERRKVMDKLEAGDPIYMKGHVMMYLGEDHGEHYLIHSGSGYGKKDKNGDHNPITVHGVFVMRVEQLMKSSEKTYLESFKLAKKFLKES